MLTITFCLIRTVYTIIALGFLCHKIKFTLAICLFQTVFHDECKFKESLLPNNYNAYESQVYRGFYIALTKHGRVKRGNKATTAMTVTHFLPRI